MTKKPLQAGQFFHIQFGTHTCKLSHQPPNEIEQKIRNMMVYEPKGNNFQMFGKNKGKKFTKDDTRRYLYNRNSREFPTGLLKKVLKQLDTVAVTGKPTSLPVEPFSVTLPPRYYQQEAHDKLVEAGRGVVVLGTGTGKTLLCAMLASSYSTSRILITTPNKRLLHQNRNEVAKFLGTEVGILGDSEKDLDHRIVVSTIQSLASRIESGDAEVMKLLTETQVWICDECHGAAADSYRLLSRHLPNATVRLGATATWTREDGCELIMEGILGDVVYTYSYAKAFEDEYLTPIRVWLREFNHGVERAPFTRKPDYATWYKKHISDNEVRNLQIALDAATLSDSGLTPCLVLVRHIPHGQLLASYLDCPFINGDHSTSEVDAVLVDFMSGKHKIIVASGILNVGVNLRELRSAINAAAGDSRSDALQKPGRGLRLHESKEFFDYVDYYDREPYYFRDHASNRKTVYAMNFTGRVQHVVPECSLIGFMESGPGPIKFMEDL